MAKDDEGVRIEDLSKQIESIRRQQVAGSKKIVSLDRRVLSMSEKLLGNGTPENSFYGRLISLEESVKTGFSKIEAAIGEMFTKAEHAAYVVAHDRALEDHLRQDQEIRNAEEAKRRKKEESRENRDERRRISVRDWIVIIVGVITMFWIGLQAMYDMGWFHHVVQGVSK